MTNSYTIPIIGGIADGTRLTVNQLPPVDRLILEAPNPIPPSAAQPDTVLTRPAPKRELYLLQRLATPIQDFFYYAPHDEDPVQHLIRLLRGYDAERAQQEAHTTLASTLSR